MVVAETEERTGRVFSEYGTPLMEVPSFNYLGLTLYSSDEIFTEVEQNLWRVKGKWGRLVKILGRDGADRRTTGIFCLAVV